MASLNLAPEELKQLEMMRNRYLQLNNSLDSLLQNVSTSQPLPSRESLQASASILQHNLKSIQDITNDNAELFQRVTVHPSTNFPGRTQEHILLQLLRKKLEPNVETWVEEARNAARSAGIDASKLGTGKVRGGGGYGEEDDDDYGVDQGDAPSDPFDEEWADIRDACFEGIKGYIETQAREPYTAAEREIGTENVRTGLKRSLDDESDEEDEDDSENESSEDEDDDMMDVDKAATGVPPPAQAVPPAGKPAVKVPAIQPEVVLWWAAGGDTNLPRNIDMEFDRKAREANRRPGGPPR
ncbi:mediator complex, subunit Med8 [Cercophora scortea]|uniref:Mediator of RNA polymerase II transcription subunit 8 n=1 Tax=Cercophora scortea TaxID=314031 RepID=A0AAE0J666_9PEZI|nr:mediator complex, subunit Med8 [Cercophora scortea]